MNPTDITQYIDIAKRRKWWIILSFLLSLLAGLTYAMITPKAFQAQTLIMIVPQKVPEDYVRSIVSTSMEDRLRTIQQQVTSRTNLEDIIKKHQLFFDPPADKMFLEEKVAILRKAISITVSQGNIFSVAYQDKDPQKAVDVANDLTANFITENLKMREGQALGTSQFLADELETTKKELEAKEELLQEYQGKYIGAMPEQLQTNLSMLEKCQARLESLSVNLSAAESRKLTIQQQMANMKMMQDQMSGIGGDNSLVETETPQGSEGSEELSSLKNQLSVLRSKYTDNHPDVVRLQKMIEKIEAEEASSKTEDKGSESDSAEAKPDLGLSMTGDFLGPQLEQADLEISNIKAEIDKIRSQAELYEKRVEETPKREQELLSLKRDYSNLKSLYDSLLKRKLEADIAMNMEKKQKGEQFRIVDTAKLPERPVKPNLNMIILFCLLFGLGSGGGIAFLVETLDTSYKTPEEIETGLKVPVLLSLPIQYTEQELKEAMRKDILSYAAVGFGFLFSSICIIFATRGADKVLDLIRKFFSGT